MAKALSNVLSVREREESVVVRLARHPNATIAMALEKSNAEFATGKVTFELSHSQS